MTRLAAVVGVVVVLMALALLDWGWRLIVLGVAWSLLLACWPERPRP